MNSPFKTALCLFAFLLALTPGASARQKAPKVYFVDGYHGGIYGHYPIEWKTRFINDQVAAHPEWRIGLEIEPETWDTVALRTPADYDRFKQIACDKRVEFTNPTYAQPYCYNISGESLIRQFEYGIRKIRSHFPDVEFVTYAVEEPCFTSSLPQILKLFGFKYASLKCPNTCWGGYSAPYGGELVNWIGPDGTSILTSPRHACEELEENSVWQTTAWGNETKYLDACRKAGIAHPVGMCYQDAGWKYGPWIGSGDSIRNQSIYVTWREYFEEVTKGKTKENYRFSQEDVRAALMWGSQVMQRIGQQVRDAENSLVMAEKAGTIAHLTDGYTYNQKQMDEAWRTLMLAQHHDSWIVPYNGLHGKGTWADAIRRWTASTEEITDGIIAQAQASFTKEGKMDKGLYLRVVNTLGVPRRQTASAKLPAYMDAGSLHVKDAAGNTVESFVTITPDGPELRFEADVPAFGYATYFVERTKPQIVPERTCKMENGRYILENETYRLAIDPAKGGVITSLVAKADGKEYADPASEYAIGELKGYFYDHGTFRSSTEAPATVVLLCDNEIEKSVRISGSIASHPFTQTVTLRSGDRKIDFDLTIDWQHDEGIGAFRQTDGFNANRRAFYDERYKLNIFFPLALTNPALTKDAPFDVCKSALEDTRFTTWDAIKHNIVLHWVDLAEEADGHAMALLADHTTSYAYGKDFPLALTVQYSGNGLWGRNYGIDAPTHLRFALVPHRGQWDAAGIQEENRAWNEPLLCSFHPQAAFENRSLVDLSGTGYELSAAYPEGDAIVVRFYNASGDQTPQTVRFGTAFARAEEIDLNGKSLAACDLHADSDKTALTLSMPRFGLKTIRLTR